jgi:phage terminase small subunit
MKFVDAYIKLGNKTQAAIEAGYSEKTAEVQGSKLLRNAKVLAYYEERLEQIKDENILDAKDVLVYFSDVVKGNVTEEVVTNTGEIVVKGPSIADKTRAGAEIMKRYPLPVDVNINGPDKVIFTLGQGSDMDEPDEDE